VYQGTVPGPSFIPGKGAVIPAVAAGGGKVFFLDTVAQAVLSYDGASGEVRRSVPTDLSAYGLDVSADGGRLLVSSYRTRFASQQRAVVTEYTVKGRKTGRVYWGLYQGRYFRDGVIGLASDLHNNNLVFRRDKEEEVLLQGSEDLLYGDPSPISDVWIAFTAAKKGVRELCLYNYETRQVYTLCQDDADPAAMTGSLGGAGPAAPAGSLEGADLAALTGSLGGAGPAAPTGLLEAADPETGTEAAGLAGPGGAAALTEEGLRWRYIRSLQASSGYLLFAYHQGKGMYKLGGVDVSGVSGAELPVMEAVFTERDISGGVSRPVAAAGAVYYRGAFSKFDALLRYPEEAAALQGVRARLALKPWAEGDVVRAAPGTPSYDALSDAPLRRYAGISYMNPFKFWIPWPLISLGRKGISLDGGGISSLMSDPTDSNRIVLSLGFDARARMATADILWTSYALGFPIEFKGSDGLDKTEDPVFRLTTASVLGTVSFGLGGERTRFSMSGGLNAAFAAQENGDAHPYTWSYDEYYYSLSLGLGASSLIRPSWALFGRGLSLYGYAHFLLDQNGPQSFSPVPRVEGVFSAALEPWVPLRLQLYGIWDEKGMDLRGRSSYYLEAAFSSAISEEYPRQKHIGLEWLAGGEVEVKLFSLDIQKSLSHLYYNRIYSSLAWRGALYDDLGRLDSDGAAAEGTVLGPSSRGSYRLAQSLLLRLGLTVSTVLLPMSPLSFTPYVWGAWKFPNLYDGNDDNDFFIGIGLEFSL
jgi:hypothetical protein